MKTLKNESATYVEQIVSAIESCYGKNAEPTNAQPTNAQLTELYSLIGKCICQQGEKAFVAHLAELLAEKLPQLGGFSMRNLRRMRGFYQTYENQPELLHKAQALGWTQNAVILDCCNTDEQRSFYIKLAAEKKLSKLALMKAIATEVFEAATQETVAEECDHCHPAVGIATQEEAVDTKDVLETQCGTFVTVCKPLHQGDAPLMGDGISKASPDNLFRKLLAIPTAIEFTRKISVYLKHPSLQTQLFKPPHMGQSPPLAVMA
ncbi:DUF1016 N-terminal domain-containing protein [Marasmitruncus massiliensis]|uniref:DUF1016 N-terminal domain-containing protein n=1 Tax=Marasmitruncus massiliensis TaxID=1944642 RepID=UPI000C7979CB|nr:DUF1016 N-terminal domain-containing protein [Marasmitruncus massiliensis]